MLILTTVAILAIVALGAGVLVVTAPSPHRAVMVDTVWDERVSFAVAFVEQHKGRPFRHAVPIEFLGEAEFEAVVTNTDALSEEDRADADDSASLLRALGMVQGPIDLLAEQASLAGSNVLAYYDPDTGQVRVRGTQLDLLARATLVHELTHAWQDQHHDLSRIDELPSQERIGLRSVAEGDASNVEDAWIASQSTPDRTVIEELSRQRAVSARERTEDLPSILTASMGAPYPIGAAYLQGIEVTEGPEGIDRALTAPPTTADQLLEPWSRDRAGAGHRRVTAPAAPPGATELRDDETLGPLDLYLVLAERIDPHEALAAADAWAGDSYRLTRESGAVCVRGTIAAADEADAAVIRNALQGWRRTVPWARIRPVGTNVELSACDPGSSATFAVPDRADVTIMLPIVRLQVWAAELEAGGSEDRAHCAADAFTDALTMDDLAQEGPLSTLRLQELRSAAIRACGR